MNLDGEEHIETLLAARNYALSLDKAKRFEEAKSLMRKMMPVARRVLGASHVQTLKMRWSYAWALYRDEGATVNDLREAVTTLEDTAPTARRVFGSAHPDVVGIETALRKARAVLRTREAQDAFGAARVQLAQEREDLARMLADASAGPSGSK